MATDATRRTEADEVLDGEMIWHARGNWTMADGTIAEADFVAVEPSLAEAVRRVLGGTWEEPLPFGPRVLMIRLHGGSDPPGG